MRELEGWRDEPIGVGLAPPPASSGLRSAPNRSPLTRPPAVPHIEMDDTSELARASEAISISGGGNRSPVVIAGSVGSGLGTSPSQYALGATPVGDSMIDHSVGARMEQPYDRSQLFMRH